MRRIAAILQLGLLIGGPAAAEPVLHEYVKPPHGKSGRIVSGQPESDPKPRGATPAENPAAIRHGDKILVEPPPSEPERPSEVVLGEHGAAADRETQARPDRATEADRTLHYVEVFNPSIVPFKRMSALDAIGDDYTLGVAPGTPQAVPSSGDTSSDRDLFWGSMMIKLPRGGGPVAIPSVAPDMRILSYETSPPAKLVFERDHADNFSVRAAQGASGQLRLVFLVDAPATYFAPRVPARLSIASLAARRPPAELPPQARASARIVLQRLGVQADMDAGEVLALLIEHFRGFKAGTPPPQSSDIYLDLALSKVGVCRHRAFAFMITANAAGLPTRYVTNEAHAFAEVWMGDAGWMRIDLGGAAAELEVANAGEKSMHRPRTPDPFPRPKAYTESYTRLKGPIDGLSKEQLADAQAPAAPGPEGMPDPSSTAPVTPRRVELPRPPAPAPVDSRRRVTLAIDSVDRKSFRGEPLRIAGHVGEGEGPEGLRVDIYLAPAGAGGEGARAVAQTATDAGGKFAVSVELPLDVLLGKYEVYAVTPGNAEIAPAISE